MHIMKKKTVIKKSGHVQWFKINNHKCIAFAGCWCKQTHVSLAHMSYKLRTTVSAVYDRNKMHYQRNTLH